MRLVPQVLLISAFVGCGGIGTGDVSQLDSSDSSLGQDEVGDTLAGDNRDDTRSGRVDDECDGNSGEGDDQHRPAGAGRRSACGAPPQEEEAPPEEEEAPSACEAPPVACSPDGAIDDTLYATNCCSGSAVTGSTYCGNAGDWQTSWASCGHICGSGLVTRINSGCIPSGRITDTLGRVPCCSGESIPSTRYCVDRSDWCTTWETCLELCR
jgi:hypothetical protein